jgi:catechol 2,3-dioxygenase-like lactoylglutathione lyase family enzyme
VAYVRTVKTASGATAVQIVWSSRVGSRSIEHIGSAHDEAELDELKAAAAQWLAAGQLALELGPDSPGPPSRSPMTRRYALIAVVHVGASLLVFGRWPLRQPTPVSILTVKPETGMLHHVELWVPDLERGKAQWGWLLGELGYQQFQDWPAGRSWRRGATYLVIEQSPTMSAVEHDRLRPGLNHLAFHAGPRQRIDALAASAPMYGWTLLFADKHPYAGGEDHYAAYLANTDGYEVELVADGGVS